MELCKWAAPKTAKSFIAWCPGPNRKIQIKGDRLRQWCCPHAVFSGRREDPKCDRSRCSALSEPSDGTRTRRISRGDEMHERIGTHRPERYCCACRKKLPPKSKGFFHQECLRVDKCWRMREKREQERQRFQDLLRRHKCPQCGHALGGAPANRKETVASDREPSRTIPRTHRRVKCHHHP
jgi:hypothetical protein